MGEAVGDLLDLQSGVVSRRQALAAGLAPHDIRRLVRRREWAAVHDGVFVTHTGTPSWTERAWAAVLAVAPAALCHDSALRLSDGPGRRGRRSDDPIHVAVDRKRTVLAPDGVVLHRLARLDSRVLWHRSPPCVRVEEAVLDLAAEAPGEYEAIALLADAVQARRTTTERIRSALDGRPRIPRRRFLVDVLDDLGSGACSVLEQAYLTRVERAHGLPRGLRQRAAWSAGRIYRDVDYDEYGLVVELDGRTFHDTARSRDRDLDRDLDTVVEGRLTIRLGWGQVFGRGCQTAVRVGLLLQQRGWAGTATPCPSCGTSRSA